MPERPKRRKNNKNKRKNKNNRPDTNKNNSDVGNVNIDNSETCHCDNEDIPVEAEVSNIVLDTKTCVQDEVMEPPKNHQYAPVATSNNPVSLTGDLNNNSNLHTNDRILDSTSEKGQNVDISDLITNYVVESPDNSLNKNKNKFKNIKSKSLDNDDSTNIVEITEDDIQIETDNALTLIDSHNVLVTDADSDIEWEKTDDLSDVCIIPQNVATGTLSVTTIPLSIAQCDQNKSLTPDEEKSLRSYLKTLNLVTQPENINTIEIKTEIEQIINHEIKQRLRKKGLTEDFFLHRLGPPRILDVIDEEGSSESSMTSRRQSYLSDKKSDIEDLEDDVFEDNKTTNKNKSIKQKVISSNSSVHKKSIGQLVPQECVLVGAKIKEPEVTEARGEWTMKTVEKLTGAEVVYLTDTSSSSSSLHEIGDDDDDTVDTDVSVRMITPTIEVTDTENFLKKTFISTDKKENISTENSQCFQTLNEDENKPLCKKPGVEHIIKIKYEDDPNKTGNLSDRADNVVKILSEKEITANHEHIIETKVENMDHNIEKRRNIDSAIKCQSTSTGDHNERIINIEAEKDIKEIENNEQDNYAQNVHEIVVLSTDNIKTNLYVKEIDEVINNRQNTQVPEIEKKTNPSDVEVKSKISQFDLETKVIKCEFNDAINNLIKEVTSDSEGADDNLKDKFTRQDSSSSVDSSQCTAKYNPTYESLNDISNIAHDEISIHNKSNAEQNISSSTSHVKDVFECVTGATTQNNGKIDTNVTKQPLRLRDICVTNIASLPYGNKILEELASVSERLQNFTALNSQTTVKNQSQENNMPHYRLPDVSTIDKISLHTKIKDPTPPPIQPRHSSLKKSQDEEHWTGIPTKSEPVYVCLSPSQKMLMDKTNTVITKDDASHLMDMHSKFVDRRGYNECYKNERQREENDFNNPPIVPFKSQTGSRLLALIRDPSLTRNISSITDRLNSLDELKVKRNTHTTFTKNNQDKFDSTRNFSFKPIPPPRPKKYSSSYYESDESSDFTDNSMRSMKSERKLFHYSTGNLNKEIESDISSIQNMHRFFTQTRDDLNDYKCPRRPSLPKDLCEQQMEYIRRKEKEVEAEIQRLEALKDNMSPVQRKGPKAPIVSEKEVIDERIKDSNNYSISRKKDVVIQTQGQETKKGKMSSLFSSSQEELLREKMYSEYVTQMAEREERKQHKVIKITNAPGAVNSKISKSMSAIDAYDSKVNNRIEKEFISKAKERWDKLGIKDPETEDERESAKDVYKEPKVIEHKIKVIEGGKEKDVKKLPSHLQEFVRFTAKDTEQSASSSAIWRPGAPPPACGSARSPGAPPPPPPPPVWSPGSAGASPLTPRKTFRPVHFEETPPARRKFLNSEQNGCTSGSESEGRLRTSQSAPVTGLSTLGGTNVTSRLPKAQNPTVTLLQKAREGQLSRGPNYIQQEKDAARLPRDRPSPPRGDPVHALRKEYASEGEAERSDYERGGTRKMADAHRKVEGIGPITKDGMPVALRSEVKDPSRWYKKMYDTIHKNKYDDDYVTIRYKSRRGQPPERVSSNKSQYAYFDPRSGYLSEPEGGLSRLGSSTWSDAYDSDVTTGPRRRTASVQEERRFNEVSSPYMPSNNKYSTLASARASQEVYKTQPGRIENYMPGRSSVIDKESKQWWDEVMDIFDGQNISSTTSLPQASPKDKKDLTSTILSKSNMARALKESGYESDSTLVFRRREDTDGPLSPAERRAAYRDLQAGGEPPLRGFRSPAPPRQESPRRYVESDVNIHYRCPVRHDPLPLVPERELARQQAEHMKRLYREQKRNKYLQELQDMQNRRHQDNFTPSQKNILPLNRYDEADKVIAKALYTFSGQTSRELSFRKGELIHVRRQIDANWYEGELHGRIGLFPYNYVEIQKGDIVQAPKKPIVVEGRARAKFDFTAQTNLELPIKKGEVVVLTRRIDQNWWEGRNGTKTGIFPDSYVTVLQEPSPSKPEPQQILSSDKPVASPAAHGLLNGSAKRSMGSHSYTPQPNSPALSNAPPATQPLPGYVARPAQATLSAAERGYGPPSGAGVDLNNTEPLYVDTNAEAVPFRAMYKYRPQNPDELELNEGDTVYVLEKCDDGWYVGSSQRTGRFGTFPGNYVERI